MSVLQRVLHYMLQWRNRDNETRIYLQDEDLIAAIKDVAQQQRRPEADVIADLTKAGLSQFLNQNELERRWASLSHREQQVVALICLGYRNYQIAETLVIAPETVKTHLQRVFNKFDLRSSRELRLALKHWDFQEWWSNNKDQQE